MRNNKGVTLTSLVIYVIVLMIVIALMSNLSGYFFKNVNQLNLKQTGEEEYLRLTSFLTKDINSENLLLVKEGTDFSLDEKKQYLIFKFEEGNMHQYIVLNENLYFLNIDSSGNTTKKIQLCSRVSGDTVFEFKNNKLDIDFTINNKNYTSSYNVTI